MKEMNELYKGLMVGLIFLTLLLSNPAFAYAIEFAESSPFDTTPLAEDSTPTPTLISENNEETNSNGSAVLNDGAGSGFSCDVSFLTSKEARAIMDLTSSGFQGKNISDGDDTNANGTNLEGLELVGQDNDGKTAVKQTPPTQAAEAERYALFNGREIVGPFGIGLVLDDTIRIGRCEYGVDERNNCRIQGNGLTYRTDGVGFKSNIVNAFDSLGDATVRATQGLSEEEYAKLQNNIKDDNSANFETGTFASGDQIKNSIWSKSYTSSNATTCNNNECVVSTYSAFDKYFNAWMTTDFVVFSLGPSLLHKASKIFTTTKARGTFKSLSKLNDKILKFKNDLTLLPSQALGQKASARYSDLYQSEGLGNYVKGLTIDKKLFASGTGGWMDDALAPGSDLMKLTKEQKGKYYELMNYLRSYSMASNASADAITKQFQAGEISYVDFGRRISKIYNEWDDVVFLDFPAWLKTNPDLVQLQGVSVKKVGTVAGEGFVDLESSAPFNFKRVMKKFEADGHWGDTWLPSADRSLGTNADAFESVGSNLQLYKLQTDSIVVPNASIDDITSHITRYGEGTLFVEIPGQGKLPLTNATKDMILNNPALPGHVNLYKGQYSPARELTPDEFTNMLADERIRGRINTAEVNSNNIMRRLDEAGFKDRKYTSILDKTFASETDMVKAYYATNVKDIMSGALLKGTLAPIVYWNAKRGFGQEQYSAYMLPDSWTTLTVSQGQDKIYADSFIDFYANTGSDQGDMFKRVFKSIPFIWTKLIELATETNTFVEKNVSKLSGGFIGDVGWENNDTVLDLAFYSHNENCAGCSANLSFEDGYFGLNGLKAPSKLQAFLVEAAERSVKEDRGTVLISYTHHSNLDGKTSDLEGDGINIATARADGKTCDQTLRDLGLGFFGTSTGGLLAFGENLGYLVGFGPGLIASGIQQMYYGRKLQDCVDDKEGYYIHFYAPPADQQKKSKSKEALSNETVAGAISKMSQGVEDLTSKTENPIADEVEKLKDQFVEFADQASSNDLLQANVELFPPNEGSLFGTEVFYIWYKDATMPSALKTEGVMVTKDGNQEVITDYTNGDLTINGKQVIDDKKEIVGLITPGDNRIPAQVVPKTVNVIGAPQTTESVFEVLPSGKVMITNQQVLSCLQSAVKDQTGITYSGNELTQVFGELSGVNTEVYGKVFVQDGEIRLEGKGQRVQGGINSKFIVDGYWQTRLQRDANNNIDAGKFRGMTFEYGTIVLNEETNELIVWLRQHKESVLSNKDVSGLKAKLTSTVDPDSDCEQPALELEATAHANDELGQQRVENFNTSMEHLGPFTQFTTDNKMYEFYAKRDKDGICKDYFRVIDKETGEVLTDSEIVGDIQQNEDGTLSFKTADGKTHSLQFSAENGVPKVSYNDGPLETLRSAQGTNGSFWYDPKTGLWYPENGIQIPLDQAFKDNGAYFGTDENGKVSGVAGNPMTFNLGQQGGSGFNIPSLPETALQLTLFIIMFLGVAFFITQRPLKIKRKKK